MTKKKENVKDVKKTDKDKPPVSSKVNSSRQTQAPVKSQKEPQTMDELLAQTGYTIKGLRRGSLVEGRVSHISHHEILIDVGAKSEGIVSDADFDLILDLLKGLKLGDKVLAYVVSPENDKGQIILSLRKAGIDHKWKTIIEAKDKGSIITVRGLEVNKGGLLADCQGIRGFIPASQVDIAYAGKPQELVGRDIQVKVLEVEQKNNRLIFSQKSALSKENEAKIKERLSKIKVGQTYEGTVVGLTPFGLFVSIDGVEGLVHISEIAWEKINDPREYFKLGDKIKVLALEVDKKNGRLNLSIKQLSQDPYQKLSKLNAQSKTIKGEIVKLTNFGAFVKLEQGVEGLIHVSKIPPEKELKVGEEVECAIESFDIEKRKISLSLVLKAKPMGYK